MSTILNCPRCGTNSYEQLRTHGHCVECLYSQEFAEPIRTETPGLEDAFAFLRRMEREAASVALVDVREIRP